MRVLLGVVLVVVDVFFLLFALSPAILEDSQPVLNVIQPVLCQPGERLLAERTVSRRGSETSYSADLTCFNPETEDSYDVTGKSVMITIAVFTVTLMLSILMFVWAGAKSSAQRIQQGWQPASSATSVFSTSIPPSNDVTTRLRELQEAYDKQLISTEEYNRIRESILKQF